MTGPADRWTVGRVTAALAQRFPLEWAESWDQVGLLVGDPAASVESVMVSLDADLRAVERAVDGGYDMLVTHHPVALEVSLPVLRTGANAAITRAIRGGVALAAYHTNLDRAPAGADALATRLGLPIVGPLEASEQQVAVVTTYVPRGDAEGLRTALAAAGAGRVGLYEGCSFSCDGEGRFSSGEGAQPTMTDADGVDEVRVEAVCAPGSESRVAAAVREMHPYEEPVILISHAGLSRGVARMGRVCELSTEETLERLSGRCSSELGVAVRMWGPGDTSVRRVAVANGSGGSFIGEALSSQADVLVTGEVRYHDALTALERGLCVIEAGHDATEWPMVPVLSRTLREVLGSDVRVDEEPPVMGWQTIERH